LKYNIFRLDLTVPKKPRKIYLIYCKNINLYKIGLSVNPEKRLKQLQTGTPYELNIVSLYDSKYPFKTESILHKSLISKKVAEDFQFNFEYLKGEWFNLSSDEILNFCDYCKKIETNIDALKIAGNPFV
jgi:hypothetical protein